METGRYLFWYEPWSLTKQLIEFEIIEISKKAIKVKFVSGHERWIPKEEFKEEYELAETLSPPSSNIETK